MAKKRNSTMEAAAAAVAAVAAAQDEIAADAALDIEAHEVTEDLLEGLRRFDTGGNRVTWYVYSDSPGRKGESEGYIEKLRTEQLDESRFKQKYGPGEYRVVGRTKDGGYVKGSHKTIRISDILADEPRAAAGGGAGDVATFMREMATAEEKRRAQRAEDFKTYATVLGPSVATILAAIISRRPSVDIAALVTALRPTTAAPTLGDMTTALVNLKAIQGDGGSGPLDIALKVLEKVQDMPQGGGGDAGWMGLLRDVIREAAPHARELIGKLGDTKQPAAAPGGLLPASATTGPPFGPGVPAALPSAAPAATPAATPPTETDEMWAVAKPWLQLQAANLHAWAASNLEVELVAEMLIKSVPKLFWLKFTPVEVIALLNRPDWWDLLTAFHSPLTPYRAWCDDVREELIATLADETGGGTPPNEGAAS